MASRILDRDFKYRNADSTDLRRTFARIRKAQRKQRLAAAKQVPEANPVPQVKQVIKARRAG
jgi:hypothetical protein